ATRAPWASEVDSSFDNFIVSYAWMEYAQEPLPPPPTDPNTNDGKPSIGPPRDYDKRHYRMPKAPAYVIFRQYPARCLTYVAERLQREGWHDGTGWEVAPPYQDPHERWFDGPVVVGKNPGGSWSGDAWRDAHKEWDKHGHRNGLLLDTDQRRALEDRA